MAKASLRKVLGRRTGSPAELSVNVVSGAAASTNIAVAGIRRRDALVAVIELQPPTAGAGNAVVADRVGITSITSDGNVQVAGQATTGNQLLIIWYKL